MPQTVKQTRRRAIPGIRVPSIVRQILPGVVDSSTKSTAEWYRGTQITVSEGHDWPPPPKDKGKALVDRGGDFWTQKKMVLQGTGRLLTIVFTSGQWTYHLGGKFLPVADAPWPPSMESSDAQLDAYGAQAIARCKPTSSVADVTTALGELRKEGLPSLPGARKWSERTSASKRAGSEYLGVQFGWLPLINDIRKVADAVRRADEILAQYERDSGKVVRRRYNFPTKTTVTESTFRTNEFARTSSFIGGSSSPPYGTIKLRREFTQRRWFSGAFTYYLPTDYNGRGGMASAARKADKLFGLQLTPEVLWNLAPWSWAVDWFTNTGDVIATLSDFIADGLILRYGYMMEHTIVRDTYTISPSGLTGQGGAILPPLVLITETKKRRRANPFGFGLTWEGLTPKQLSIVAALGLSKGRR